MKISRKESTVFIPVTFFVTVESVGDLQEFFSFVMNGRDCSVKASLIAELQRVAMEQRISSLV